MGSRFRSGVVTSLPPEFYLRTDPVQIAQDLLGCMLHTGSGDQHTSGLIVETEAYAGISDRASHAWNGRKTQRNEAMYAEGGCAYVYLCYGLHEMMNVVTAPAGTPHAILIRAIAPVLGVELQLQRLGQSYLRPVNFNGPGKLTRALGINRSMNALPLRGETLCIAPRTGPAPEIIASPRVGVGYAGSDALLPYRFRIAGHPFSGK